MAQKFPFDLWQLQIFNAVVVAGGLTKASRELGISQSAISQALANLEEAMGITLIDRTTRPLQTTTAGRLLAERSQALLQDAHELEAIMRSTSYHSAPVLRISMIASLTTTLGTELVKELTKSVKRCALFANLRGVSEEQFNSREIDILIGVDMLKDADGVQSIPLVIEPCVLALPGEWDIEVNSLADLRGLNFIRHTHRTSAGRQIERTIRQLRLDFPRNFESDTVDTIASMIAGGLGWSITTPLMALQVQDRFRGVVLKPLPRVKARRRIDLYARKAELGPIPQRVAHELAHLLRANILPRLRDFLPWVAADFLVIEQPRDGL